MQSWIPWIVIIVVLAMVVGPIAMLKPNKRQQRIALLRQQANAQHISVRLEPEPDGLVAAGQTPQLVAYYSIHIDSKKLPHWRLQKTSFAHEIHIAQYWQWQGGESLALTPAKLSALELLLASVPKDVLAIGCDKTGIGVMWGESKQVPLTEIQALLESLKSFVQT